MKTRWNHQFWVAAVASVLLTRAVEGAGVVVNPYLSISERNAFALRPLPPPPDNTPRVPKLPAPKVYLTGITIIHGQKKAWFRVYDPKFPNDLAKSKGVSLREGERSGGLEVLNIYEKSGAVNVKNAGQETMLSFKNNANKSIAVNLQRGAPGRPVQVYNGGPLPGQRVGYAPRKHFGTGPHSEIGRPPAKFPAA